MSVTSSLKKAVEDIIDVRSFCVRPGLLKERHTFGVIKTLDLINKRLVTNYGEGELKNMRGGGHVKFYPYEKGG